MKHAPLHIETPVFEAREASLRLKKHIDLKMECFQPVGSFKIRGLGLFCQHAVSGGKTHLVSSSGGNAGYAAAYAARKLGIKATVIVPETTSIAAQNKIKTEDAEVIVHGKNWDAAHAHALEYNREVDGFIVHPYEGALTWEGHATLIDEVVQQSEKPDAIILSVGGGGLLCGVIQGLHNNEWSDVPVIAVETEGAASLNAALEAGEIVSLKAIDTIATSLGARQVTEQALIWAQKHPIISRVVSDRQALQACQLFAQDHRVSVEPACGAALSLIYDNADMIAAYEHVLFIVCGGIGGYQDYAHN